MYFGRHFFRYLTSSLLNFPKTGFVAVTLEIDVAEGWVDMMGGLER